MQKCCKLSTLRNLCATSFWHVSLAYGVDLSFSYKVFWICRARFTALPDLPLCLKVGCGAQPTKWNIKVDCECKTKWFGWIIFNLNLLNIRINDQIAPEIVFLAFFKNKLAKKME